MNKTKANTFIMIILTSHLNSSGQIASNYCMCLIELIAIMAFVFINYILVLSFFTCSPSLVSIGAQLALLYMPSCPQAAALYIPGDGTGSLCSFSHPQWHNSVWLHSTSTALLILNKGCKTVYSLLLRQLMDCF